MMRRSSWVITAALVSVALAAGTVLAQRSRVAGPLVRLEPVSTRAFGQAKPAAAPATQKPGAKGQPNQTLLMNFTVDGFCVDCHNDEEKKGSLSLESFDIAKADQHLGTVEKMIRK